MVKLKALSEAEMEEARINYDISGKVGALLPIHTTEKPPEWPMYSYERPAWLLWNAVAAELHVNGWSEKEIKTWLQSKATRWALDGDLGNAIRDLGRKYGASLAKDSRN
jgi:hypothetical protein